MAGAPLGRAEGTCAPEDFAPLRRDAPSAARGAGAAGFGFLGPRLGPAFAEEGPPSGRRHVEEAVDVELRALAQALLVARKALGGRAHRHLGERSDEGRLKEAPGVLVGIELVDGLARVAHRSVEDRNGEPGGRLA